MSSEPKTNRIKRNSSHDTAHEDHRKRPRNRTTQSCLNCHASKRMCDRKRPACGRCVQLGLTGLCVYEIDDPTQRGGTQDDSSQLRQRVAELEGVIREMKNKPHPRWVQSGSNSESEKWQSRQQTHAANGSVDSSDTSSTSAPLSPTVAESPSDSSGSCAQSVCIPPPPYVFSSSELTYTPTDTTLNPNPSHMRNPYHAAPSPSSDMSSALATPTDEVSACAPAIVGDQHASANDFDFSSMFTSYPDLISYTEGFSHAERPPRPRLHPVTIPQYNKTCLTAHQSASPDEDRHCGCLNEPSSYNAVLELSLRLRRAADYLSRSGNHRMGARCLLHQRVAELDTFATNALGNMSSPVEESPQPRPMTNSLGGAMTAPANLYIANSRRLPLPPPALPGHSHHALRPLDTTQTMPASPPAFGDGFLSWRGLGMMR